MSKIIIKKKRGKTTIINRLAYPETINERVNNAIYSGVFEGFLPITVKQKRKGTRMECNTQGLFTLNEYFGGIVSRKMFLDFVEQIVTLIKNCETNMVSANNLDLQNDRIFIDPHTKKVKCIYWPIVNNQNSDPPYLFLKQLPYDISFSAHEDRSFVEQYSAFFEGYNPFSLNNFERLLIKLQGKRVSSISRTLSGSLSETLTNERKSNAVSSKKENIEYDPFAYEPYENDSSDNGFQHRSEEYVSKKQINDVVFCNACGAKNINGANFCSICGNKLTSVDYVEAVSAHPPVDRGTTVLGSDTGGTVVLGYDEAETPLHPTLIRAKTGEKIVVNKVAFRLGKEQVFCDYTIYDNNFISRSHADILIKDNRYYVVDKNSTNKTFVDGRVIKSETLVEIFDGTKIKLANEEFDFVLD